MNIDEMNLGQLMARLKALDESVSQQVVHEIAAALADLVRLIEQRDEGAEAAALGKALAAAIAQIKAPVVNAPVTVNVPKLDQPTIQLTVAAPQMRGFSLIPRRPQYGGPPERYDFVPLVDGA